MIIFISFEVIAVLLIILFLCADSLARDIIQWMIYNWKIVEFGVHTSFMLIVLLEIPCIKEKGKGFILWFSFWNIVRSIVAANYGLFLLNDIISNYSTWGFFDKILSILGIQVCLLPLASYTLFEIVLDEMGDITWKSVLIAGIVSTGGIILGALFLFFCT